ncbi:hypothetical protein A3H15_01320 [Candidatus Kaiserbacteria bacterium RIFCSPLOWO2_12_FULL_50_28]|uniref:GDP-mannose 4,6-dehydratase n=1 Tax=Candidatus Kaiserbacteria bacterium RIFCSPLOWO2_12_FULL_50_28 TaxID=1798527 RepID=A0A1F6FMY6_9BACT|nr:MAG: hypothetical protein A3H15_01320 [Candidatus Kaiserbacteria bacterium RIFCSPLOWO2_12_FULL_50_28]
MKKTRKRALITGITGQDGSYLAEYLISRNYDVWGIIRRTSLDPLMRLKTIAHSPRLHLLYGNLRDSPAITRALKEAQPDEIYNLAAQSDVGISFKCPEETWEVNYAGAKRLIREAMRICPKARIYHASTSEMFGTTPPPQNELSAFAPVSPYGEAKLKAYRELVCGYRAKHKLFICSGILFNHESSRRGEHFVTRKTTLSLAHIKLGLQKSFALGNLEAKRDWGFAGDSVRAMHLMLQQKTPKDYVIATGESHTVREFVEAAAKELGMTIRWSGKGLREVGKDAKGRIVVRVDKKFFRPSEVRDLRGDASSARKELRWKSHTSFKQLVRMMVSADLKNVRQQMH